METAASALPTSTRTRCDRKHDLRVVTSGYYTGEEGSFINTISCDADVTLGMPAPTMSGAWMTALILVLLAGGLLITRFRLG